MFSSVIRNGYEEYCWIYLVYSEDWETFLRDYKQMVDEGYIQQITPNWCVIHQYAF